MISLDEHRLVHYPELGRLSLGAFFRRLLRDLGCEPERVEDALIVHGARRAQLGNASTRRFFLFGLSVSGVAYGRGASDSPRAVADALAAFLCGRTTVDAMEERFPFVKLGSAARAHERGEIVEHRWAECLAWSPESPPKQTLAPLVHAASARPKLRQLLPFVNLRALCFSRTTGRPYRAVEAFATPAPDEPERYDVFSGARCIGRGDADWAAAALDAAVPDDVGHAVDGASTDLD